MVCLKTLIHSLSQILKQVITLVIIQNDLFLADLSTGDLCAAELSIHGGFFIAELSTR